MKTVLVTGCLGTVGIFTTNKLLSMGYNVIGVDNCSGNPIERLKDINKSDKFQFINNGVDDLSVCFNNNQIDAILHLAANISTYDSFENYRSYIDNNITLTMDLLDYAKRYNIKRFVYASSSSVYGIESSYPSIETNITNPVSIYGVTKQTCEHFLRIYHDTFGLETIALRYYNIFAPIKYYGYRTVVPLFGDLIMNNKQIHIYNKGQQRRQFVPIDNIVHANILALETDNRDCFGQAFNITVDDEPIALIDLVNLLYKLLNKTPNYTLKPEKSLGDTDVVWGSSDKAKNYLGYIVQKSMYNGIEEYCRYINNEMRDCG